MQSVSRKGGKKRNDKRLLRSMLELDWLLTLKKRFCGRLLAALSLISAQFQTSPRYGKAAVASRRSLFNDANHLIFFVSTFSVCLPQFLPLPLATDRSSTLLTTMFPEECRRDQYQPLSYGWVPAAFINAATHNYTRIL